MDDNIPDPPLTMTLYFKIREFTRPTYTWKYLFFESTIASLLLYMIVLLLDFSIYLFIPILMSLYIISTGMTISTENDKRNNPLYLMDIKDYKLGLIVVLSMTVLYPILVYSSFTTDILLVIAVHLGYIMSIVTRGDIYRNEREFYTNKESNVSELWDKASISMEYGMKKIENDKKYDSFYWIKKAKILYESISEKEERPVLKEVASLLVSACVFYSVAIHSTSRKRSIKYERTARSLYKESEELIHFRLCDRCNNIYNKSNVKSKIKDGDKIIFCNTCLYQNSNRKSDTKNWSKKEQYTKEKKYESGQITKSKFDDITIDEAITVLGLDKPISSVDEIHNAFRSKVKDAHPDTGGSEKEFKKVKKSREKLIDEYK